MQTEARQKQNALEAATGVIRAQQQELADLLDRIRLEHRDHLRRLREVERQLAETDKRLDRAVGTASVSPSSSHTLEVAGLRERQQYLRQQQAWLAERLVALATSARKLQVVIRQTQLSGDYLLGDAVAEGESGRCVELGQFHALEVQEEERRRLAREIHDGPAQILANAIFELEFCQRLSEKDPKRLSAELERLKNDLREGLAEVRYFIFDLRPGPLAELGLVATLRRYAETYQSRFGLEVVLDLDADLPRLSSAKEMATFRIIQEALQNTRKHSGATRVSISLRREDETLVATVEDNGQGFEVAAVSAGSARHFGLQSMQERAQLVRAELQIDSRPGCGARVSLRVPLEQSPDL